MGLWLQPFISYCLCAACAADPSRVLACPTSDGLFCAIRPLPFLIPTFPNDNTVIFISAVAVRLLQDLGFDLLVY
jgi:hypothetical protein